MLTNIYLENVLQNIKGFKGVHSSNNIPFLSQDNSSVIVNFDKDYEPGSHFIVIFRRNKNEILYFDPLKLSIFPTDIANYLTLFKHVFDLSVPIQSFNSSYCGFYCVLFIFCQIIGKKYWNEICEKFNQRNEKNDKKCIEMICKTFITYKRILKKK